MGADGGTQAGDTTGELSSERRPLLSHGDDSLGPPQIASRDPGPIGDRGADRGADGSSTLDRASPLRASTSLGKTEGEAHGFDAGGSEHAMPMLMRCPDGYRVTYARHRE